jgi:ribose transport system substrate-binding protein
MKRLALVVSMAMVLAVLAACGGGSSAPNKGAATVDSSKKPNVAYVTNGIASFWVIADKGCQKAAKDLNANVEVLMPADGIGDQKRMVQNLLTKGVDGIAISPIDPANQTDILNEAAANTKLITHDSDAPETKRLCYVGMDNYTAGRMCGQLVKEALPDGGKIMVFVGRIEQLNAKQRRQGLIDELLGRSNDSTRFDAPGTELKGDKFVILDTRTDQFDFSKAKAQAEDAIAKYPDLNCMVGLFAYNPPKCLAAVKEANKLGKIKIVAFDEDDATLQGIKDGDVYGTIVQNPYEYGYQSVKILAGLARGDQSVLPKGGTFVDIPARKITKANVDEFWMELKKLTGK